MKKVSAKMFFTVLWKGVCQAFGWFFRLFGYKRDGKVARGVWCLFAISMTVIIAIAAINKLYSFSESLCYKLGGKDLACDDAYCYERTHITRDICFHNHEDGHGYIYNIHTGEKFLKEVAWIAKPMYKDSLVCFSNGEKRGYFSKWTGRMVIEPKYDHAWIFSEGVAGVEEGGRIKFIDVSGKVIIDNGLTYIPGRDDYVFHGGYCVVTSSDGDSCGLMDKTGRMVLPMEYNSIAPSNDYKLWKVRKGDEMAVLDKDMRTIVPFAKCSIYIDEGTIDVTMADHIIRKYDYEGELIHDFYINGVRMLEYETAEIRYGKAEFSDIDNTEIQTAAYHPVATARLRAYVAGDGFEGLMTADGHIVTMPLYQHIKAIGPDLYLCTSTNYDMVTVNGKGELVK